MMQVLFTKTAHMHHVPIATWKSMRRTYQTQIQDTTNRLTSFVLESLEDIQNPRTNEATKQEVLSPKQHFLC